MKHTLAVLVENKPGVLARISNMFARRGFNIESLAVGTTERPEISRVTLRVDCDDTSLAQIEKQMHKLVNVLRITELTPGDSIVFELAGAPEEIDSFEELLRPHGVKELVRTGRVGLSRASSKSTIRRRQLVLR